MTFLNYCLPTVILIGVCNRASVNTIVGLATSIVVWMIGAYMNGTSLLDPAIYGMPDNTLFVALAIVAVADTLNDHLGKRHTNKDDKDKGE